MSDWLRRLAADPRVLLLCLVVQLVLYWLFLLYVQPSPGLVAYQRF
jgi:hypothetical protein